MAGEERQVNDGLPKNAVVYIPFFGWIPALGFWFTEKDKETRWHVVQSLVMHAVVFAVYLVVLPILRMTIVLLPIAFVAQGIMAVVFVLACLWLMIQVREGKPGRLPFVADVADSLIKKMRD